MAMQTMKGNSIAGAMILEDHLKHVLTKAKPKNKYLPRSNHSAFGDFPKTHMPNKMGSGLF